MNPSFRDTKHSRRAALAGSVMGIAAALPRAAGAAAPLDVKSVLQINDLDQHIWREELDPFVPQRVYDLHTHLTRAEFNLDPKAKYEAQTLALSSAAFERAGSVELLDEAEALLYPGRSVSHLLMPMPHQRCDFEAANRFIAGEAAKVKNGAALMVVHPSMTEQDVDSAVRRHRFLGFKPYRWYSVTGDMQECRIPDFMPHHLLKVADRYGLIIGLHLSKKAAIADPDNLEDLEKLSEKYPRVRWALYHCARSYSDWAMEKAAPRLRRLPNLWFETSSVCETDAFDALFATAAPGRICYGSDDFPVGVTRGKYIAWGHAWTQMDETNQKFSKDHCDGRMTFVRYEMLRAMRRAARHARFTREQIEDIFYNNAVRLIESVRADLAAA